ncbi:pentaheme c-type cytochrome TorC [Histophilus somni]|uniref:pentaheme c-type cytochrome TorC n=1 Tax=Histophilus somni TaxID=731 RepID=UPI00094B0B2B|nr:pentaheme c-type cytochrome TorC [Histophilus somni]
MRIFKSIKQFFVKPSAKIGLGILLVGGAFVGIVGWIIFNAVLDHTSQEEFCISCHSMQYPLEELKQTAHWSNDKGVSASCPDCHLPHNTVDKYIRKIQATKEIFAELSGKISSKTDFEKHRLEMAEREWARMSANGSAECKACHSYDRMDFDKMSEIARNAMIPAAEKDQSCIDCHKGIAHHLPEMSHSSSKGNGLPSSSLQANKIYYTENNVALFADETMGQEIGQLETGVPVHFVKTTPNADLVELEMWRKDKGFGRIWYNQFGKNITDAILTKEFMSAEPKYDVLESVEDPITGLTWQKVKLSVWIGKNQLIENIDNLWAEAEKIYKTQCSTCHRQPDVKHFDSNTWIGLFNGMVGFTNIDKPTGKRVLRYLQMHSSDFQPHDNNH